MHRNRILGKRFQAQARHSTVHKLFAGCRTQSDNAHTGLMYNPFHPRRGGAPAPPVVIAIVLTLAAAILSPPGAVAAVHMNAVPRAVFAVRIERALQCRMDDGTRLLADVYHPKWQEKSPSILVRIPYTKTLKNQLLTDFAGRLWAERGYTVVIQTTRGRGGSGGTYYPLIHERADGLSTLAWLKQQPWFNGQVLTWGGSAFGYTQLALSDSTDPPISGMFIYESTSDFHRMFYPGGAFALQSALTWAVNSNGTRDLPKWPQPEEISAGAFNVPLLQADNRISGHNIDFYDDWARHNEADEYWHSLDASSLIRKLNAPVMMMAGWYDPFLPAQLADYAALNPNPKSRLIIGPWRHGGDFQFPNQPIHEPFRLRTITDAADWFDQVLGKQPQSIAPVMIYVMGANKWRAEQEWPLKRAKYISYNLAPDRTVSYVHNPQNPRPTLGGAVIGPAPAVEDHQPIANAEFRSDFVSFTLPVLDHDTEVTGPIKAILYVTTTASSADFNLKLLDVTPSGQSYNVSEGVLRRSYQPNTPTRIEIEMWPTSMVFRKGHSIRLEVSSSNFPHFDVNPHTALQTLHCSPDKPSQLILPIIPPSP